MGLALKDQYKFEEAIDAYKKAISLNPELQKIAANDSDLINLSVYPSFIEIIEADYDYSEKFQNNLPFE